MCYVFCRNNWGENIIFLTLPVNSMKTKLLLRISVAAKKI
ncbi:hypothetical protein HMPREF1981_03042 [Bacteroides pyogenes F0041]|uniref:Uncharacterized protein n=1 Tax=Bacteroides pyogenes F0041 TaxID=1321819 RepID=U2CCB6_9BACE|nr:hypothetical protein HMPREF1981_03042 [Bacteroides pyogenes F0041]